MQARAVGDDLPNGSVKTQLKRGNASRQFPRFQTAPSNCYEIGDRLLKRPWK